MMLSPEKRVSPDGEKSKVRSGTRRSNRGRVFQEFEKGRIGEDGHERCG
jgi:hypothetical protein